MICQLIKQLLKTKLFIVKGDVDISSNIKIAIISGSKSDEHIIKQVTDILDQFNIPYESKILSAHRNHDKLQAYVKASKAEVFIGIAGLAAHLPGVLASLTIKPVIGVPVAVKLNGLDSLLSIVQMPPKVPVACVGIDSGKNAALLAIQILSIENNKLQTKLLNFRSS